MTVKNSYINFYFKKQITIYKKKFKSWFQIGYTHDDIIFKSETICDICLDYSNEKLGLHRHDVANRTKHNLQLIWVLLNNCHFYNHFYKLFIKWSPLRLILSTHNYHYCYESSQRSLISRFREILKNVTPFPEQYPRCLGLYIGGSSSSVRQ